jgi:hypothetical protein
VTEIYHRWQNAEKYLSPTIDFLPQLLIISILLFVAGLTDNLFSISASLDGWASQSLFTASKVCSVVFGTVVFILACTILHAIFWPLHSPFPSTLTNIINIGCIWSMGHVLIPGLYILYRWLPKPLDHYIWRVRDWVEDHKIGLQTYTDTSRIRNRHITAYHNIMSQTFDDNLLDDGSSALMAMLEANPARDDNALAEYMMQLVAYLCTPVASSRSAMTAARAIYDYNPWGPGKQI